MAKSFRSPRARLMAVTIGKHAGIGAIEAHERNVMAVSRRIITLEAKIRGLKKSLTVARVELKAMRRELRTMLQRDSSMGIEDSPMLDTAGKADAVDAATAFAEGRKR